MVSAALSDALVDPSKSLIELYSKIHLSSSLDDFPAVVSSHFSQIFEDRVAFRQISPLDIAHPPSTYSDCSLVRFRAMVQDTSASPEVYLAKLPKSGHCGGWGLSDSLTHDEDEINLDYSVLRERSVVWAVSVPGEADWVMEDINTEEDHVTASAEIMNVSAIRPHKYPIASHSHLGVQVKIYDNTAESLKPTEVRTFVGILSNENLSAVSAADSAIVPTLHVLFSRPHPRTLVPFAYPLVHPVEDSPTVRELYQEIVRWLADEALGGDEEVAEWVLLIAITKVQLRSPSSLNPPSLTVSSFPPPPSSTALLKPTATVLHALSLLLPLSLHVPLSLDLLNEALFAPESKDEDLHSGVLQLPVGTTVVVTDSGITDGTLKEKGLRNIQTLQQCITSQSISYAFPYSLFTFSTDLSFILLSESKKNAILETSINIPLQPRSSQSLYKPKEDIKLPASEKLVAFRALLGGAKVGAISVGEAVAERIQEDFVQERQKKGGAAVTPEDLELRLAVSRLMTLCFHEKELTVGTWGRVKSLDGKRKERLVKALAKH